MSQAEENPPDDEHEQQEQPDTPDTSATADDLDPKDCVRRIKIETVIGKVVIRDDSAPLHELESAANRLIDRVENVQRDHIHTTDGSDTYR